MVAHSAPPGYRQSLAPRRPKLDAHIGFIDQILHDDIGAPKKQRHTIQRIYDRLREERGFDGGYTTVRDYVHPRRQRMKEAFVPLAHPAGHAQADFGEAWAVIGGVPQSILYDNTRLAVAKILGDGTRKRSTLFGALQSHYVFEDRYGRPGKGNDKGKVEGMVGFARRTFMVPFPRARDFADLNVMLETRCRERQGKTLRGKTASIGARMTADQAVFQDLPAVPFEACDKRPGRVTSQALVRYKNTDYSVPVAYAHRDVMVKAYVEEMVIVADGQEIARHRRSYEAGDFVFDPLHYLALLEQKVGALDQAAPLQGWDLPAEFATLRRLLEARLSPKNRRAAGKREYVQVLRLIETFPFATVHGAVRDALHLNALSYDAIKHLALCRVEKRQPKLDLAAYPHLPVARVTTTSPSSYMSLLSGEPA
jgi:transposase